MLTLLLILIPILTGTALFFIPDKEVKKLSVISAMVSLVIGLIALMNFDTDEGVQFIMNFAWIEVLGSRFYIGMDGISLAMVLLSNILSILILISTLKDTYTHTFRFYALMMVMQGAMNGVFVAQDLFLYYIFWELSLIPAYFLVLWWGNGETVAITFKFFLYTLLGSLFMLGGIIWLSFQNGIASTNIETIYALSIPQETQLYIFLAFMIAYAVKIPIFPFHTWQPDTYTIAPSPTTMLLSGIMLKMGLYSIIRWVIPVVPYAVYAYGKYVMFIVCIGIFYASAIALAQKDLKRLFAYSSIAHVGLITAGIFSTNQIGLNGAIIQMIAHGVNVVGLFYICQILFRMNNTHEISRFGGLRLTAPLFSGMYLVILMASIALPLTSGFPGEFMILNAIYTTNSWLALLAGSGVVLGAIYMLLSYQKVMLGEVNPLNVTFGDIDLLDKLVLIPLIILIFAIGIYPQAILNLTQTPVNQILNLYQSEINTLLNK
ncbi:MAG: NADH-quinone oxidoreductase subunit M [Saprospiraceae bacterium]|nr:NADH-quinone oxidoreductase subunit M [Saprospiraceae bacterium]